MAKEESDLTLRGGCSIYGTSGIWKKMDAVMWDFIRLSDL